MPAASDYGNWNNTPTYNPVNLDSLNPLAIYQKGLQFRDAKRQYDASQAFRTLVSQGNDPGTPEGAAAVSKGLAGLGLSAEGQQYLDSYSKLRGQNAVTTGMQQTQGANAMAPLTTEFQNQLASMQAQGRSGADASRSFQNNVFGHIKGLPPELQKQVYQAAMGYSDKLRQYGQPGQMQSPGVMDYSQPGTAGSNAESQFKAGVLAPQGGSNANLPTDMSDLETQYGGENRPKTKTEEGPVWNKMMGKFDPQGQGNVIRGSLRYNNMPPEEKKVYSDYFGSTLGQVPTEDLYRTSQGQKEGKQNIESGKWDVNGSQAQAWLKQNPNSGINTADLAARSANQENLLNKDLPDIKNQLYSYRQLVPILDEYRGGDKSKFINRIQNWFNDKVWSDEKAAQFNSLMTLMGENSAPRVAAGQGTATALSYVQGMSDRLGSADAIKASAQANLKNSKQRWESNTESTTPYFKKKYGNFGAIAKPYGISFEGAPVNPSQGAGATKDNPIDVGEEDLTPENTSKFRGKWIRQKSNGRVGQVP